MHVAHTSQRHTKCTDAIALTHTRGGFPSIEGVSRTQRTFTAYLHPRNRGSVRSLDRPTRCRRHRCLHHSRNTAAAAATGQRPVHHDYRKKPDTTTTRQSGVNRTYVTVIATTPRNVDGHRRRVISSYILFKARSLTVLLLIPAVRQY